MSKITNGVIGLVILLHLGFLVMEMFLWTNPTMSANFDLTPEQAILTASLAANQGPVSYTHLTLPTTREV